MKRDDYERSVEGVRARGLARDEWTMWNTRNPSRPGDQVVLLRQGRSGAGLIGFGLRTEGPMKYSKEGRPEYPIVFHNLRSLDEQPFIERAVLEEFGFATNDRRPGNEISGARLSALERCCEEMLHAPLARWCSGFVVPGAGAS
jgi:hypothetical protein